MCKVKAQQKQKGLCNLEIDPSLAYAFLIRGFRLSQDITKLEENLFELRVIK